MVTSFRVGCNCYARSYIASQSVSVRVVVLIKELATHFFFSSPNKITIRAMSMIIYVLSNAAPI